MIRDQNILPAYQKTGRIEAACRRYSVGKSTMRKMAAEAHAVIRIGNCYLINFSIMDAYLDKMALEAGGLGGEG